MPPFPGKYVGVKLKFHWDQFPRNFPVAKVGRVWRVGRVARLLRGSYEELFPVEFELNTVPGVPARLHLRYEALRCSQNSR